MSETAPHPETMSFALLDSPEQIRAGQMYTGMRLRVNSHNELSGRTPVTWEDVQGTFVERDAPGYYGGMVRAIFLDRTFPTGQVVQLGLNCGGRTIQVEINGTWHSVTRLAT